jgi:hypothetical protein
MLLLFTLIIPLKSSVITRAMHKLVKQECLRYSFALMFWSQRSWAVNHQ